MVDRALFSESMVGGREHIAAAECDASFERGDAPALGGAGTRRQRMARSLLPDDVSFSLRPPSPGRDGFLRVSRFRRSPLLVLFSAGFLAVFCIPYFTVGALLPEDGIGDLFSLTTVLFQLFWLAGWSVGVAFLALLFLGSLFATERVLARPGELLVRLELFGAGVTARYIASELRGLHRVEPGGDPAQGDRGRHLAFEAGGETQRIGVDLEAGEAEALLARLRDLLGREVLAAAPGPPEDPGRRAAGPAPPASASAAPSPRTTTRDRPTGPKDSAGLARRSASTDFLSLDTLALLAANLVPLFGVLFLGWSVGEIMLLFWAESGVIGIWNLARLWVIGRWMAVPVGIFFTGHFGAFMAGHLFFLYSFFVWDPSVDVPLGEVAASFWYLLPAVAALFVSHGISFFVNFIGRREYEGRTLSDQMTAPYGRIMVMHVTIILGGFLTLAFADALGPLLLLLGLKIATDLRAHRRAHREDPA